MDRLRALRNKEIMLVDLQTIVSKADLQKMTHQLVDEILSYMMDCTDKDVTFVPIDPDADDPFGNEDEADLAWTLGHVIVHVAASAEESAFLAAELARGVENHGRSRYEIPWREVETIKFCRDHMEESRRICLASLEMWPEKPHQEITYETWPGSPRVNASGRYILGLSHAYSHLGQIRDIINQSWES
jgi:hypothetical protein